MKKTLLLFLFLLPFLGISQNIELVKWNNSGYSANVLVPASQVSAPAISGNNLANTNSSGYSSTQWPVGNAINPDKYIQIGIKAEDGYKIDLSSIKFTYLTVNELTDSPKKFQVRYLKGSQSTWTILEDYQISSKIKNETITLPPAFTLLPGETVYFRFYGYDRANTYWDGATWGLVNSLTTDGGKYSVPTIIGKVSPYIPGITANDDSVTIYQNNFAFINVLNNDLAGTNPISSVTIASQSANGTAIVGSDNRIKFTPTAGFTGPTSFTYTIGDGTNTSTATVNVNVITSAAVSLVEWSGPDNTLPTITAPPAAVAAENFTVGSGTQLALQPQGDGYNGYGWPTQFSIDESKYFEFTTSAKTGYKLKLDKFNFTYNQDTNHFIERYQVRYSKDNFATSFLLVDEPANMGKTNKSLDLSNVTLYPNEKITIRIYGYKLRSRQNPNSPIFLANAASRSQGETVPTITGTVLSYDEKDLNANDDLVSTQENRAIAFDPLVNDVHTTGATITYTQPPSTAGTVSANGTIFTFKPATNFKGTTTFTYTLTSGAQNSTATVTVYVNELSPKLIIWNGILQTPKAVVTDPNISGKDLTVGGNGVSYRNDLNEFFVLGLQNGGSTAENLNRYIEVGVTPKEKYNLTLTEFKFRYKSPGSEGANMFQVRYSKDKNFPDNGTVLLGPTIAVKDTETDIAIPFPSGTRVLGDKGETFYIRIYPYAVSNLSNGYFILKNSDGGDIGPTLSGIVEPSNIITAVADVAKTNTNTAVDIPILANDENYIPLVSITTTQPTVGGSVTVSDDKTNITFTPTPGFTGTSTFDYTIFNGLNYSTATVTVTVNCEAPGNQIDFGPNQWIGYVYKLTDNATIPPNITLSGLPDSNIATYIGRVTENKNFDRDMGDGGPSGLTTEIPCEAAPTDRFFIRYKMHVDITEAGTYRFDLGSDDGVRLFIGDNEVFSSWGDRGYANDSFTKDLEVGSYDFVLEYYENGGAARNSFFFGIPIGDPSEYGDKVWNVYGYVNNDITLDNVRYAGYYVDPNLNPDSTNYWPKDKSPSSATIWQGVQIPNDNFTVVYKRKGFECGRYQIQHVNHDDIVEIYIDGERVFYNYNWDYPSLPIENGKLYALNSESKVEIRLQENGGDSNLSIEFNKTNVNYTDGLGDESGSNLVVNSSQTLSSDLTVCSCTVNADYTLTIPKDVTLTVDENINVADGGKLLILDGGSLMQTSTSKSMFTGNSTAFEIQRIASVRRYDFTYWSMPVTKAGFKMKHLSPNTLADKYFYFDTAVGNWALDYNGEMEMLTGIGYNIRAPQDHDLTTASDFIGKFTGVPNNGNIPTVVAAGKWNLIGNPYPSAIDAAQFLDENDGVGALYFWAHANLPVNDGTDKYYRYKDDFVTYNGLGTAGPAPFDGYIAAAQGFIIKAPTATINFNNGQRRPGNNTKFFKTAKTTVEKHRMWLNFSNAAGDVKQILVGYAQGATNSIDTNFDATSMAASGSIDFYSINSSKKLVIQGRAWPFVKTDVVTFGYMAASKGDYTISINKADGIFNEDQEVFLQDKTTGKMTNLRLENYKFTSEAGTFNSRFVIRYVNTSLGTDDFENVENGVFVSVKSKIVNVKSSTENISEVQIYNIAGQNLYTKNKIDSQELQISNLQAGNQVLLVKVILENGTVVTKKIIFN
ncbi:MULTISPECIES: Ig-like domain-containing protein [Flavobacterium]|uniref:Ig-like domain-containing protein n=1 Tax=Flavobacterium TaxID=237 RepID=UPI00118377B1|nr:MULTISPECIES: Ig-like domain-containing protein [Flavobacterium]MCR4033182.1 Ig-like domain-containing protein [Flavobacterium panacis]